MVKFCVNFFVLVFLVWEVFGVSLWRDDANLYTNKRAKAVDDIVLVNIVESLEAVGKSKTERRKGVGISGGGELGAMKLPSVSGEGKSKYTADGETARAGKIKAVVAAKVLEVLPNGHLLIKGSKIIRVNNQQQMIEISGILNPADISAENTVLSTQLAECNINYGGETKFTKKHRPNIIIRFFEKVFDFIF